MARHPQHRTIRTGGQVAQRPAPTQGHANPPSMLWPVMQHVAPLAERPDVAAPAPTVGRIVIEMRCRQHHFGCRDWPSSARADERSLRPLLCRQVCCASSDQRPSPRRCTGLRCGRPQPWQRPLARTKRTQWPTAASRSGRVAQLRLDRHGLFRLRLPGPRSAPAAYGGRESRYSQDGPNATQVITKILF